MGKEHEQEERIQSSFTVMPRQRHRSLFCILYSVFRLNLLTPYSLFLIPAFLPRISPAELLSRQVALQNNRGDQNRTG